MDRTTRAAAALRLTLQLAAATATLACTRDPLAGPAPRPDVTAAVPLPGPLEGPDPWREPFEQAAEGLVYTSEIDSPFEYFRLPPAGEVPLTASGFLALLGATPTTPVRELTFDEFFARHTTRVDPYDAASLALVPRYQQLQFTIEEALNDRAVFCLGTVFIRCYVAGTDVSGEVMGVGVWVLET